MRGPTDPPPRPTIRSLRAALPLVAALVATTGGLVAPSEARAGALAPIDVFAASVGADTVWRDVVVDALDPDPACDDNTAFVQWVRGQVAAISPSTLDVLASFGVFDWAYFWTLGVDQDDTDEHLGFMGEYTKELERRHRDNRRFWAVPTDDVLLQGMHGAVIADDAKMAPLVSFVLGADTATAQAIVDLVQATIEQDPAIGYDHPILSLNAFAFSGEIPGLGPVPDKIVMGDGLLTALDAIGLGDVAPDFVHAHEFAHHVQDEVGVFDGGPPSPESTRRTELMADAFAAYEVAHVHGATFRNRRLLQTSAAAFNVGDCEFDSENHHGTPEQRAAAVDWGLHHATDPQPRSYVIPPAELVGLFDAALPNLVAH